MTLLATSPTPREILENVLEELGPPNEIKINLYSPSISEYITKFCIENFGFGPEHSSIKQTYHNLTIENMLRIYGRIGLGFNELIWVKREENSPSPSYTIRLKPSSTDLSKVKGHIDISYHNQKFEKQIESVKTKLEGYGLKVNMSHINGMIL